MPTVVANGVQLYYEELGAGTPILCIHGTSSSALVWGDATQELAQHGRCISYDRRGCFRSERPRPYEMTSVEEHAADAAALLDALSATPAMVIGRSYGGAIGLELARRHPDKVLALALLEPAVLTLDPAAAAWAQPLTDEVLAAAERDPSSVAEVFLRAVVGDEAWESFPAPLKEMFTANGPAILAELRGGALDITAAELAQITHPTLIVSAQDSPEAFRRADASLAAALPQAETVSIAGGHLIKPDQPVILDFIDHHAGAAA